MTLYNMLEAEAWHQGQREKEEAIASGAGSEVWGMVVESTTGCTPYEPIEVQLVTV